MPLKRLFRYENKEVDVAKNSSDKKPSGKNVFAVVIVSSNVDHDEGNNNEKTYKNSLNKMHYKLIFSANYILYTV